MLQSSETQGSMLTQAPPSKIGKAMTAGVQAVKKGWGEYPTEEGKAGQVLFGCGDGVPADSSFINRLKSDLANSYYWTGSFWPDYFFFVANWHPFLGIFFCHPNHPWTKWVRIEMFLISLFITLVPSAAIVSYVDNSNVSAICSPKTPLIIGFVTIPDIICGVVLYQMAIAHSRCPNTCGSCFELLKKCCIFYVFVCALATSGVCYLMVKNTGVEWTRLFQPLLEGKLWSYVTWFPIWLLLPCQLGFLDLWCWERFWARRAAKGEGSMESGMMEVDAQDPSSTSAV